MVHTIQHSVPCSIATNVFFQFSRLKNVGSIIALAAGCAQRLEFTGKRCSSIFIGISSPPQDTRGRVLHSVRSILLLPSCQLGACVRVCACVHYERMCVLVRLLDPVERNFVRSHFLYWVRSFAARWTNWGLTNTMLCDTSPVFNIHDTGCILG